MTTGWALPLLLPCSALQRSELPLVMKSTATRETQSGKKRQQCHGEKVFYH